MRRSHHGFTLVELLVVISIIALLLALLLPAVQRAREVAKAVQCASNSRQHALQVQMYADEHNGFFPATPEARAYTLGGKDGELTGYAADTESAAEHRPLNQGGYDSGEAIWQCPSDNCRPASSIYDLEGAETFFDAFGSSYRYNTKDRRDPVAGLIREGNSSNAEMYRLYDAQRTAHLVVISDTDIATYRTNDTLGDPTRLGVYWHTPGGPDITRDPMANIAFADGHAEMVEVTDEPRRHKFGPGYHFDPPDDF